MEALLALDGNILLFIQEHLRADWLTPVMLVITRLGGLGKIWIAVSLLLLCFKKTRWAGAAGLLGLIFSLAVNNVLLKNLVARIRPYEVVEGLRLIAPRATDFSFPSGHTGSSFAAAVAICCMLKGSGMRWQYFLLVFAALMGYTRLYVGIHYPTDVLAGLVTGVLCGYLAYRVLAYVRGRMEAGGHTA